MLNIQQFNALFESAIAAISNAERVTREQLRDISRTILEAVHQTEDIGYVNRLLSVLTPMNRKTAVLYFRAFSGFKYSEEESKFTKKDKANYAEKVKATSAFLDDPLNNIWTWAMRNVEVEAKEFTLDKITAGVASFMKKGDKAGFNKADIISALLAGLTVDDLHEVMTKLAAEAEH